MLRPLRLLEERSLATALRHLTVLDFPGPFGVSESLRVCFTEHRLSSDLMNIRGALAPVALTACGCATPHRPQPLAGGYSKVRIQKAVYRSVFVGNGFIHQSAVDDCAPPRADELSVPRRRNCFRVLGVDPDVKRTKVSIPGRTLATRNTDGSRGQALPGECV